MTAESIRYPAILPRLQMGWRMESGGARHRISVCTRRLIAEGHTGIRLQRSLHNLIAGDPTEVLAVDGIACMAGCDRPIAVGFSAAGKASNLFGGIDADHDAGHLPAFAQFYSMLADGWCSERHRPAGLAGKIIARIPGPGGLAP